MKFTYSGKRPRISSLSLSISMGKNGINVKSNQTRDTWKRLNKILNRKKRKVETCSTFKADYREITDPVKKLSTTFVVTFQASVPI